MERLETACLTVSLLELLNLSSTSTARFLTFRTKYNLNLFFDCLINFVSFSPDWDDERPTLEPKLSLKPGITPYGAISQNRGHRDFRDLGANLMLSKAYI